MNLGVTDVFSDWADLSGIIGKPDLKVSKVSLPAETMVRGFLNAQLSCPKLSCEILLVARANWYSKLEHLADKETLNSIRLLQDLEIRILYSV